MAVSYTHLDVYKRQGTDGQPGAGYGEMCTTEDLGQVPGIILYKSYVKDINPMGMSYIEHTSSHYVETVSYTHLFPSGEKRANIS